MPDLNSVPASPRNPTSNPAPTSAPAASSSAQASRQSSTPASRRTSQIYPMSPPPLPLASPGGNAHGASTGHSSHGSHAFPPLSPSLAGHAPSVDGAGVPMRHPRPLTAAELHLELEKEQEAVVNRLTRELSALRAHSASVASTASSATSGVFLEATDAAHTGSMAGPTHPTSARRHRSSSSVSRTSMSASYAGIPLNSATANIPHTHHRYSVSSNPAHTEPASAQMARTVSTPRYEEVAHYRQELEEAKKENELLKRRIRELERMLRGDEGNRGRGGVSSSNGTAAGDAPAAAGGE
ncbi:hypothetical protein BS50DRAFT_241585 [Corynespora cassiicola Philippines]|uniref:Uncharacterized protein n=1 Tax=Corynespora cassiicola Philippines TaxID=1448308 RepID=A0A2T2P2Y5_CORCC|nr:hypothetical protein BS50DRAFT_241585 [Corynespora cassiicola Philippines]